jgi:hypothetical protein
MCARLDICYDITLSLTMVMNSDDNVSVGFTLRLKMVWNHFFAQSG